MTQKKEITIVDILCEIAQIKGGMKYVVQTMANSSFLDERIDLLKRFNELC